MIVLRRLTERHKKHAMWLLTGNPQSEHNFFDGLYAEPHADYLVRQPCLSVYLQFNQLYASL